MLNPNKALKGKFCPRPFDQMQIIADDQVTVCCANWLPRLIGTISEKGLMGVWNSAAAQEIRKSILDGSFRYCDHQLCPLIQSESLPDYSALTPEHQAIVARQNIIMDHLPDLVVLAYDRSCNLSCPSCRNQEFFFPEGSYRVGGG